ncbi:hypothetical protein INR49_009595 [Caranx melampygus]|nr:hypothetical protein INR49_009595 [Caranx melampygus]
MMCQTPGSVRVRVTSRPLRILPGRGGHHQCQQSGRHRPVGHWAAADQWDSSVASPVLSRLRTRDEEHGDVGTVYEKTNAEVEMKKINREEFWEQAKREEELRKEEERRKAAEERQRFEEERMELERKEQENREKRYREREQQIEEHRRKLQEEEEARERLRNQTIIAAEPSWRTEPGQEGVRGGGGEGHHRSALRKPPRVLQAEGESHDYQRGHLPGVRPQDRPFGQPVLEAAAQSQQPQPTPPAPGRVPLRTPTHARTQPAVAAGDDDDDNEARTERNMAAVSPIPKIVTTPIKEDLSREEDDVRDEWDSAPEQDQKPLVQETAAAKPVQSVAPQARDSSGFSQWDSGTDNLVNLWDSSSAPAAADPSQSSQSSNLVDLMGDSDVLPSSHRPAAAASASASGRPQPLLSFDEMMDGTFCSSAGTEDDPSSLVDVTGPEQMTLSYQHALQHASGEELEDGQLLMTNGRRC